MKYRIYNQLFGIHYFNNQLINSEHPIYKIDEFKKDYPKPEDDESFAISSNKDVVESSESFISNYMGIYLTKGSFLFYCLSMSVHLW